MKTIVQLTVDHDNAAHAHHKAVSHRQWASQKAEQTFGGAEEGRYAIELEKALAAEREAERAAKRALAAMQKARAQ